MNWEKKRFNNFSAREMDLLVDLTIEHKHIIECKKTDNATNERKEAAWLDIQEKFNSVSHTGRSSKMLRSKWESLKKLTKKKYATSKINMYETDGGFADNATVTPTENKILNVIGVGPEEIQPNFKSNGTPLDSNESDSFVPYSANELMEIVPTSDNWAIWNHSQLSAHMDKTSQPNVTLLTSSDHTLPTVEEQSPDEKLMVLSETTTDGMSVHDLCASTATRRKLRGKFKRKSKVYGELAKKRIELISLQMQIMKEESEKKEKRLAERHAIELKILLADLENRTGKRHDLRELLHQETDSSRMSLDSEHMTVKVEKLDEDNRLETEQESH